MKINRGRLQSTAYASAPAPQGALYVGIDISKWQIDFCYRRAGGPPQLDRLGRTAKDLAKWAKQLARLQPKTVVVEATGGLERPVVAALAEAGVPVAVVNPRQARAFAQAIGRFAKTDPIDAALLAEFAERLEPEARPLPPAAVQDLRDLLSRREDLITIRTPERNRQGHAVEPRVRRSIAKALRLLDQQLADIERELDDFFGRNRSWRAASSGCGR